MCKAIIKTTGRSTTGLHAHLKSKHKIGTKALTQKRDNIINPPDIANSATASTKRLYSQTSKKQKITDHFSGNSLEIKISRMVCKDGLPFRVFSTSSDARPLYC